MWWAVALAVGGKIISEDGLPLFHLFLSPKGKTSGDLFLYALWWLEFSHKIRL